MNKERFGRGRCQNSGEYQRCPFSAIKSLEKSARRRSQELEMNQISIICILKLDLKLFPYRIHNKHQPAANDEKTRVDMCNWLNDKMVENHNWIHKVWVSDEAHFHHDGYANSKKNLF